MTVAETEAWIEEMFAAGASAAALAEMEGSVNERCKAEGFRPGTVSFVNCRNLLGERLVALVKAGALAKIGELLRDVPSAPSPLIGAEPELGKALKCYERESGDIIGCQDL